MPVAGVSLSDSPVPIPRITRPGNMHSERAEGLRDDRRVIAERGREHARPHHDARRARAQRTEPCQRERRVAAGVPPRLEMIADEHGLEADLFREAGEVEQLARGELLGRRLVAQPQHRIMPHRRHAAPRRGRRPSSRSSGSSGGARPRSRVPVRAGRLVQRGALKRRTPELADQRLHRLRRQLLSVCGTGRAADGFVHQRAAHVVGAAVQARLSPARAELDPGHLDVAEVRMQRQARDGVHQDGFAQRRALARQPFAVQGRFHVHERQRHELGEAARFLLQVAQTQQVPRPVRVALHVPEHDRGGRRQSHRVRLRHDVQPALRRHLVGADDAAHLVVEDLGRGARQRTQARSLELLQKLADRQPERARAVRDLERRERVHVDVGHRFLRGTADAQVGLAGERRMDAALHADFGAATLPGFAHTPPDLGQVHDVRLTAQMPRASCLWRTHRSRSGTGRCWCS